MLRFAYVQLRIFASTTKLNYLGALCIACQCWGLHQMKRQILFWLSSISINQHESDSLSLFFVLSCVWLFRCSFFTLTHTRSLPFSHLLPNFRYTFTTPFHCSLIVFFVSAVSHMSNICPTSPYKYMGRYNSKEWKIKEKVTKHFSASLFCIM